MWSELLPKLVGGTIVDHDAPDEPTEITGFFLTDSYVKIVGRDFSFGAVRGNIGISAGKEPRTFEVHTTFGLNATVRMPPI